MKTKDVAKLTGCSVRTLQYYDKIGLLCPKRNMENDYREYTEQDLDTLQQILFFKACGFQLKKIQTILMNEDFDQMRAFEIQKKYLLYEQQRIQAMLATLDKTMLSLKGETTMTQNEKFIGFDFSNNPYEEEARKRWGDDIIDKSNKNISKQGQAKTANGMNDLFCELVTLRNESPKSEPVQKAMDKMFNYFNHQFGNIYTLETFAELGKMYVSDDRFTKNIDQFGDGLAQFLSEAMDFYSKNTI